MSWTSSFLPGLRMLTRRSIRTDTSNQENSHKNEGFLKSAWHRLTQHHNDSSSQDTKTGEKDEGKGKDEDAPKEGSDDSKKS